MEAPARPTASQQVNGLKERKSFFIDKESNPSAPSKLRAMKQEVAPLAWPAGETFNQQATEAVTHVVLTYSSRAGRYLSGICELAGVLLYGLSNDDIRKPSMDHEADTF